MQPRIATLLDDSAASERTALEAIPNLPQLAAGPRITVPVELASVSEDSRAKKPVPRIEHHGKDHSVASGLQPRVATHRQKSSVPLARVLNDEGPAHPGQQSLPPISSAHLAVAPAVPFSGRLSDILIDPSQQHSNKRRKVEGYKSPTAPTGGEHAHFTLPKPPLPKKTSRRSRIPPLLQGLHQPPPLPPEGRLFPPITGEAGGFGRDIGDRVSLRSPAGIEEEREKEKENADGSGRATVNNEARADEERSRTKDVHVPADEARKENHGAETSITAQANGKSKEKKVRNKWSEEETRDLLVGVSKFGIGSWKKILQHEEFTFNNRTAVDLKDRFRTCCPGQGLKDRQTRAKGGAKDEASKNSDNASSMSGTEDARSQTASSTVLEPSTKAPRKPRSDTHRKDADELAKLGIEEPFFKTNRRQRREFTEKDDANLLKGFEKYGAVWHSMRDDKSLGFSSRHPTDLRDRFRIRYTEKYAEAGYKLKPKDKELKERRENENSSGAGSEAQAPIEPEKDVNALRHEVIISSTETSKPTAPKLRAHALLQPLRDSFPTAFEFSDLLSEDGEGGHSPITLSRNIFNWADANPTYSSTTSAAATLPTLVADGGLNLFPAMDGLHIDPRATLNSMPLTAANTISGVSSHPPGSNHPAHALPSIQSSNMFPPQIPATTAPSSAPAMPAVTHPSTSSKQTLDALLRTPNLPTIVYPHVPMASARNAMHNLPPPSDLLSGLDLDLRQEPHASGLAFDEVMNIGFAMSASVAGLAPPLAAGSSGRAFFSSSDEPFGEHSVLNSSI